jgi:hypothetical protein
MRFGHGSWFLVYIYICKRGLSGIGNCFSGRSDLTCEHDANKLTKKQALTNAEIEQYEANRKVESIGIVLK